MSEPLRLLLVEDSPKDAELLLDELQRLGFDSTVLRVETAEAMAAALSTDTWDIVISDYTVPHFGAPSALEVLRQHGQDLPFIVLSGSIGEEIAVAMMKAGADDYLLKDHLGRLGPVIRRELAEAANRRARQAAEEQVRLLTQAIRQAPVTFIITDPRGDIVYVNPRFSDITGYTFDEVRGRNPRLLKSSQTPAETYAELWKTIIAGREWHGELVNLRKDGTPFWVAATIAPVLDETGRITHFLGVQEDVTDHKLVEQSLREQAQLLDQASDAIYVRDLDGRVSYWNRGAERLFGWLHAEVFGRTLTELNLREFDGASEPGTDLLSAGRWSGERPYTTKDGRAVQTFLRLTVIFNDVGQPTAVFAMLTDITEKKRMEARVLQAQRLDSLGSLASGLAHDLNNVLSPILMASQVLKERVTDPVDQAMVASLEASALRGAGIVRQVLTFARGVDGERKVVQVKHLLREMAGIATETFPPTIKVRCHASAELAPVLGDATQLHQILMNLCINARDAMPTGGTLLLQGENVEVDEALAMMNPGAAPGSYLRIRVSDTGTGIAAENLPHLFEPFFTTKKEGTGTGLGLATVLGLTRNHGGFLRFHTKVDHGTTFEVYLPAISPTATATPPEAARPPPRGSGERILVVDDEPAIRVVTARLLEEYGYRPTTSTDGVDAVAAYVREPGGFAAVITDMVMPGMDGPTLVRTLHGINPALRIIGMTGRENRERLDPPEQLGIGAMLTKPFSAHQLLIELAGVLHAPVVPLRRESEPPWRSRSSPPYAAGGSADDGSPTVPREHS